MRPQKSDPAKSSRKLPLGVVRVVSLAAAGTLGYLIRSAGEAPAASARSRVSAMPTSAGDVSSRPASRQAGEDFPVSWPESIPREKEALRDYAIGILRNSDPVERTYRFLALLRAASKEELGVLIEARDMRAAQGVIRGEVEPSLNFRMGALLAEERLVQRFAGTKEIFATQELITQVEGWNKADPVAARAWVNSLPEGDARNSMIETIAAEMAFAGERGVSELLAGVPERLRKNVVDQVAARMCARFGLGPALDRLTEPSTGPAGEGSEWMAAAAVRLIDWGTYDWKSRRAVAAAVESRLERLPLTNEKLQSLAGAYASMDFGEGMAWAARVEAQGAGVAPSGSLLSSAIESSAPEALAGVEEWLTSHPDIPGRDKAIASFAKRVEKADPEKAAHWMRQVEGSQ